MRKPDFSLCENKGADQLRSNCEADQRLCFRYTDSTIPFLLKSEISSFYPSSVAAQLRLCRTWSETPKPGFLMLRLIFEGFFYTLHFKWPFVTSSIYTNMYDHRFRYYYKRWSVYINLLKSSLAAVCVC